MSLFSKITAVLMAAWLFVLSSCGTIIYPDRQGQPRGGQLDLAVVGMDAILCFFFLIPGIVAFIVDFHTGAIYLPEGETRGRRVIHFDPATTTKEDIARLIEKETGVKVSLDDPRMQVKKIKASEVK